MPNFNGDTQTLREPHGSNMNHNTYSPPNPLYIRSQIDLLLHYKGVAAFRPQPSPIEVLPPRENQRPAQHSSEKVAEDGSINLVLLIAGLAAGRISTREAAATIWTLYS